MLPSVSTTQSSLFAIIVFVFVFVYVVLIQSYFDLYLNDVLTWTIVFHSHTANLLHSVSINILQPLPPDRYAIDTQVTFAFAPIATWQNSHFLHYRHKRHIRYYSHNRSVVWSLPPRFAPPSLNRCYGDFVESLPWRLASLWPPSPLSLQTSLPVSLPPLTPPLPLLPLPPLPLPLPPPMSWRLPFSMRLHPEPGRIISIIYS